jgi:hypothetical protein
MDDTERHEVGGEESVVGTRNLDPANLTDVVVRHGAEDDRLRGVPTAAMCGFSNTG